MEHCGNVAQCVGLHVTKLITMSKQLHSILYRKEIRKSQTLFSVCQFCNQHMHCFLDECTPFLSISLVLSSSSFDINYLCAMSSVNWYVFLYVIPLSHFRSTSAAFPRNLHLLVAVFSSNSSQALLFSRNVSTGFMCASFLMSLFLVWSVLPISAYSLLLSCFRPRHLSDSYYPLKFPCS